MGFRHLVSYPREQGSLYRRPKLAGSLGGALRVRLLVAVLIACAPLSGVGTAYAANANKVQAPESSGWFFPETGIGYGVAPAEFGAISQSDFGSRGILFASSSSDLGLPFAVAVQGPLGYLQASGYSERATVPRLLAGGLVARDGGTYTVRDLEIVDQLTPSLSLDIGYNLDLDDHFFAGRAAQDGGLYDGLLPSTGFVTSAYSALTDRSSYFGATMALADGLNLRLGESILEPYRADFGVPALNYLAQIGFDRRQAEASMAGVDWAFAPWGGLSLDASQSADRNGFWDAGSPSGLPLAKSANTSALGVSAHLGFGSGWVTTFSYNEGVTQLDLKPAGNVVGAADMLRGGAYGLAIAKHGLFGDDTFGLALTRPLQIYSGGLDFGSVASADPLANLLLENVRSPLTGQTRETDLDFGYVTTFMDGALALQANAGYQMNLAGQTGVNGVSVLSRAKINF